MGLRPAAFSALSAAISSLLRRDSSSKKRNTTSSPICIALRNIDSGDSWMPM
jgi:hypothetical protein